MAGLHNISNHTSEGEGHQQPPEEANENILPDQSTELLQSVDLKEPPSNEKLTYSKNSSLLVYFLWVVGICSLFAYIYVDVRVSYIDHRLTRNLPSPEERKILYFISRISHLFTYTFLSFSAVWALYKAQKKRTVLYFVWFLELLVLSGLAEQLWIMEIFNYYPGLIVSFAAMIGIFLIKLLQEFPLHLTKKDVVFSLHHRGFGKWLIGPLSWFLDIKKIWLIFLPLFLVIAWLVPGINFVVRSWLINGIALIIGFCYIFIQINCSTPKQLQPLYWVLWAMWVNFLFSIYLIITQFFNVGLMDDGGRLLFTASLVSLIIFCLMTVYFTDLLDAGLILRKTFIYGSLLLILLAFFGTVEHYLIHSLAHWLHLKNSVVSSIFAGITGMLFHPLKEKLSHWVKHFEKQTMPVSEV